MQLTKLLLLFTLATAVFAQTHPRIWINSSNIGAYRTRWASGTDAAFNALKTQCDAYLPGTVYPPKSAQGRYDYYAAGSDGPREQAANPNIGEGYQGAGGGSANGYWEAVINLGTCYQMTIAGVGQNLTLAANYAAKGLTILDNMALRPGEMLITSGVRAGQTRYIHDSGFANGTAWASGTTVVNGAVSAGASTISLRGLTPSGTLLAGDSFNIGSAAYIVKANTAADGSGIATVTFGRFHARGPIVTHETAATFIADATPVTHEIALLSYGSNIPVVPVTATISGVGGNTVVNGNWNVTWMGTQYGHLLKLVGSDNRSGAIQSPLPHEALYNQGYGARFFGMGMAIGYDWFYNELSPTQRTNLRDAIHRWIREAQRNSYSQAHVGGNYYAGQSAAMIHGALAIEQEDSRGAALYDEWYANEWSSLNRYRYNANGIITPCPTSATWHCYGMKYYYNNILVDTFFPDGANYGWLATQNILWQVFAVKTARGIDLSTTPDSWLWHESVAKSLVHQTKPNRKTFDTRTKIFSSQDPSQIHGDTMYVIGHALRTLGSGSSFAPYFQSYVNTVFANTTNNGKTYFNTALFSDPAASATDYTTLPLSFYEAGSGQFHSRSDWSTSGISTHFIAGPNVHSEEGGKDTKDRGSITIVRGDPAISAAQNRMARFVTDVYYELYKEINKASYADDKTIGEGVPGFQNVLFVHHTGTRWKQGYFGPGAPTGNACKQTNTSGLSRRIDATSFTYARATGLRDNYYPAGYTGTVGDYCAGSKPFTAWTRDMLYVRPKLVLVYDRVRGIGDNAWDRYINWGFGLTPASVSPPTGMSRYNVIEGAVFKGSAFGIKPDSHTTTLVNEGNFNKAYRVEYRPAAAAADHNFFFAFDAAAALGNVYTLTKRDGTNFDAVQAAEINTVAAFATNDTPTLPGSYAFESTNATDHRVVGLAASTAYGISASASLVTISSGGSDGVSNAAGVLSFSIPAGGGGAIGNIVLGSSPGALNATCYEGGSNPANQNVTLSAVGGIAAVTPSDSVGWLSETLSGGSPPRDTPETMTAAFNCSGLTASASPYTTNISVTSATGGVTNSPLLIPVTLTVTQPAVLGLSASSMEFSATLGGPNPPSQTVTATLNVVGDMTIQDDAAWVSVDPNSATATTSQEITVSLDITGLAAGTHVGHVTVASGTATNSPLDVVITLEIIPPASGTLATISGQTAIQAIYTSPNRASCTIEACQDANCTQIAATVTDAGGFRQRRSLLVGLQSDRTYPVMGNCSGSLLVGSGVTKSPNTTATAIPVNVFDSAADNIVVDYGTAADSLGTQATGSCSAGRCTATMTWTADLFAHYRVTYKVGSTTIRVDPVRVTIQR